ncbi:MAG: alpha/beta fold hydrolase [Christensenellales bacterium]
MAMQSEKRRFMNAEHIGNYVEVAGVPIHYIEYGEGDTILFIHDYGQSMYAWRKNFYELGECFKAVAIDLAGFGYSGKPDMEYTIRNQTELIKGFIDDRGLGSVHIVAIGSGAVIGLDLAAQYPYCVGKMVLLSPGEPVSGKGLSQKLLFNRTFARLGTKLLNEKSMRSLQWNRFFDKTNISDEMIREYYMPLSDKVSKIIYADSIHSFDESTVLKELRTIDNSVLIMWGMDDNLRTEEDMEIYSVPLVHSHLLKVRNCGNAFNEEKDEQYNALVMEFLQWRGEL